MSNVSTENAIWSSVIRAISRNEQTEKCSSKAKELSQAEGGSL